MAYFFMALSKRRHRRTLAINIALSFFLLSVVAFARIRQLLATNIGSSGGGLSPQFSVKLALSASSTRLSPELWASGGVSLHRVDIAEQVFR